MKAARLTVRICAAIYCLIACPMRAGAHSPIEGLGTFYSHFLHPATVLPHALLLVAVSLMLGQQGRSIAQVALGALGAAFATGLATATAGGLDIVSEHVLVFSSLVIGGLVCLDLRMPIAIPVLVATGTGLAIGLDSAISINGLRDTVLAVAGLAVGVFYLAIVIVGLTVAAEKHWQRLAIRIGGSWIFAISVMVIALSMASLARRTAAAAALTFG